jgi:thymidylate synthase ThyX
MAQLESETPLVQTSSEGLKSLTDAGHAELSHWVTSTTDQVYAFTTDADPLMVSSAMARLSRNANDARTIIADEFYSKGSKDEELINRVVNDFGDDSVMQLFPIQMGFDNISNVATKAVERGRFGSYLEQSSRYIRFDRRDSSGEFRYHKPAELDALTAAEYKDSLDDIFEIYSDLYEKTFKHIMATSVVPKDQQDPAWRRACSAQALDAIRGLLPAAANASVGFEGSAQSVFNMLLHLESENLPELQKIGKAALGAVRQVAPVFFERVDMPLRGQLASDNKRFTRADTRALADRLMAGRGFEVVQGAHVKLLGVDGSEDELIAKILTDGSRYSYEQSAEVVATLSDAEKQEVIETYVGTRYNRRVKPGRAFELPHYLFEIQCDYGAFRDIQRHRVVDGFEWQPLQPYLGHSRPAVIDEAGLTADYERAFEISQQAYEMLASRGYEDQAQYATLFGHYMRATTKVNARSLTHTAELRTSPQGHESYRKVYQDMYRAVEAVHPNVAKAMKFINQEDDPEFNLARLGAEQAKERKLAALALSAESEK